MPAQRTIRITTTLLGGLLLAEAAIAEGSYRTGPEVGTRIPEFEVLDQFGELRNFENLRDFSERVGIGFPLLADPRSRLIERFDILNDRSVEPDNPYFGFAYAGCYLIDKNGVVREKFFNEKNNDRYTSASILVHKFDAEADSRQGRAETKHLTLTWSASNAGLRPGQRAALVLEAELKPTMHVYAPGDHRYISVKWTVNEVEGLETLEPSYPPAGMKHLPAIKQTVPVYHGSLRVVRDIHVLGSLEYPEALEGVDRIAVAGEFRYQACDEKLCYPPTTIPLEWTFELQPHDRTRVPEELRRAGD